MTKAQESEIAKLKKQLAKVGKVKSVITAKAETKKSVLGNFVIIYEKATESGKPKSWYDFHSSMEWKNEVS